MWLSLTRPGMDKLENDWIRDANVSMDRISGRVSGENSDNIYFCKKRLKQI